MPPVEAIPVDVDGRRVRVTRPDKVLFPERGYTKLDLVRYYLAVAPGVLRGCRQRPVVLLRYPDGIAGTAFFQKHVPQPRPAWLQSAMVTFPSGRRGELPVVADVAHVVWLVNLGCIDLHPWPVRAGDVDHPDELRVDLDPGPDVPFATVRRVALVVHEVLDSLGMVAYPKTSGSRGMHVYVRIHPRWDFGTVRRCALALARDVERRAPTLATSKWWKEERHGVFVDYNQNARDRTTAAPYSVRPNPDARVSCPVRWDEVPEVEPSDLRLDTVPERFATLGDPAAGIDDRAFPLDPLLDLVARDEARGLGDAPWPPHFPKQEGEPRRVPPSRARRRGPASEPSLRSPS